MKQKLNVCFIFAIVILSWTLVKSWISTTCTCNAYDRSYSWVKRTMKNRLKLSEIRKIRIITLHLDEDLNSNCFITYHLAYFLVLYDIVDQLENWRAPFLYTMKCWLVYLQSLYKKHELLHLFELYGQKICVPYALQLSETKKAKIFSSFLNHLTETYHERSTLSFCSDLGQCCWTLGTDRSPCQTFGHCGWQETHFRIPVHED